MIVKIAAPDVGCWVLDSYTKEKLLKTHDNEQEIPRESNESEVCNDGWLNTSQEAIKNCFRLK